jgi:alcohol dehydrogenase YqhD (iron-dependent ADH family)
MTPTFTWPVPQRTVSSGFLDPRSYGPHSAIDVPAPLGTPVQAIAEALGGRTLDEGIAHLRELMQQVKLPYRLREHGIKEEDLAAIAQDGIHPDRMTNNPRPLDPQAIHAILRELW